MVIVKLTDGREFEANSDISLLDAAHSAGVALPYSCRTGRCSTCKAKVLSGSTRPIIDESGLTPNELSEGWILTCARIAQSDLVLEAEYLGDVAIPPPKIFPCRISHLEHLAPDVIKVILRLPPATEFCCIPGQYIDVIGPNGIRRSYSLSNANFSNKVLELHIRSVEGGAMSQYWFNQAKVNDLLRLNGPLGSFFLRENTNTDLIFLATGTGIAPVKAILESMPSLADERQPKSVTILWGGRTLQDLYLNISELFNEYTYIPVLSRPDEDWTGAKGHIQDVLLNMNPDLRSVTIYACGSNEMIQSAKARLVNAGLPLKNYYSDAFVSSENN